MSSWITQLLTLLAVMVGALASFVSTRLTDRSRWRREERFRWDTKKLECYSDYANAVLQYINLGYRISAGRGLVEDVQPMDANPAALKALDAAEAELRTHWARINMLGNPAVIAAASDWNQEAWILEQFARDRRHGQAEFAKASQERRNAERRFHNAVRAELGIVSGNLPDGTVYPKHILGTPSL